MQKRIILANKIDKEISLSQSLFDAFIDVNRDEFLKFNHTSLDPQPHISNQWITSPLTIATMLEALELEGVDSILEVGCGTGYQSAILSKLVRRVFCIERIKKLYDEAKEHFSNLNITNIHLKYDDGNKGWMEFAPFDRIIICASAKKINSNLLNQLVDGGILIAPIQRDDKQYIIKFIKDRGMLIEQVIKECVFVPLLDGVE